MRVEVRVRVRVRVRVGIRVGVRVRVRATPTPTPTPNPSQAAFLNSSVELVATTETVSSPINSGVMLLKPNLGTYRYYC